jgi:hypothetical protein
MSTPLAGQRFSKWTALSRVDSLRWVFQCDCGETVIRFFTNIVRGKSISCAKCGGLSRAKHYTRENKCKRTQTTWINMTKRCQYTDDKSYHRYGGRGIKVCDRWAVYENFYNDMGKRPHGMTLDRINPNGDYCPENCRWATMKEQARNKPNNKILTVSGESKTQAEWAEIKGMLSITIAARLRAGWSHEEAVLTPVKKLNFLTK